MNRSKSVPAWEQLGWIWSVIFYLALFLPLAYWLLWGEAAPAERWTAIALAMIGGLAHSVYIFLLPRWGINVRGRPVYGLVYAGLITGVTFGLIAKHDVFFFILSGYFSQLFYFLPIGLSIPISLVLMAVLGIWANDIDSLAGAWKQPVVWVWLLAGICGSLVALWINAIIRQTSRQQALIEELRRTQDELSASQHTAGVLAERQRLAREIHDTLAQGFISVVTHLEAADQALDRDLPTARRHMEQATATARESLGQARRVVQDLRPQVLDGSSLGDVLQREADKWSQRTGVASNVTTTGSVLPLHPQTEVTLLRAVQESLANIQKHAGASHVNITLSYVPDRVLLDVQDDGKGFQPLNIDVGDANSGGFGLIAMRQRVEAQDGLVLVESSPGQGTTVVVEIPLQTY